MAATGAQVDAVRKLVRESVATVDAIAPSALHAVLPALRAARDELRKDLKQWLATVPDGGDRFGAFQKQQALRSLEAALERAEELEPAMSAALTKTRHLTGPLAVQNLDLEVQRLGAIFGGGIPVIPQINAAAIVAKGDRVLWKRNERSAARYAGAVGDDIQRLIAVGLAKGETFEQLVTRLRRIGAPAAKGRPIDPGADADDISNGLFRRYKWWADRMVRTEAMNAYNVQHDEAIEYANARRPEGDEEFLRRWDAAADVRVCVLCADLDGKVTTINGVFPGGISAPPRHPCCRCVVLAWMRRWGDMRGESPAKGHAPETVRREIEAPIPKPEPVKPEPESAKPERAKPARRKPAEKPLPEMPAVPAVDRAAEAFLKHVKKGDYTAAVKAVDAAIEKTYKFRPSATPNRYAAVSDIGMESVDHSGNKISAVGLRSWDGDIRISTAMDRQAKAYIEAFGARRPADLMDALEEHSYALGRYRAAAAKSKRPALSDGSPERNERIKVYEQLKENGHGVRVILHEALHGFSPVSGSAYAGHGGKIEEITNETVTRMVARDLFGIPASRLIGSYNRDIGAAVDALVELTGKHPDDAFADLARASERFKRRTVELRSAASVSRAFSEDIGQEIGMSAAKVEGIMARHLDK